MKRPGLTLAMILAGTASAFAHQSGAAHTHPHLIWPETAVALVLVAAAGALMFLPRRKAVRVKKTDHDPR